MRLLVIFTLFVLLASFKFSNKLALPGQALIANDTTEVLELCIQKSFHRYKMPSVSTVTKKYYFGDSILLTAEKLAINSLPKKVDTLKFKLLDKKSICNLILSDPDKENRPHYLCIDSFEKKGKTFTVLIANHSCEEYASGGGLLITIIKERDSFTVTSISGFSIN